MSHFASFFADSAIRPSNSTLNCLAGSCADIGPNPDCWFTVISRLSPDLTRACAVNCVERCAYLDTSLTIAPLAFVTAL